jgi:ribosomal RNA assembly protein
MEYSYELKIPKERVAILIGKSGEVKKRIESETSSKLNVDSQEGSVQITGDDALGLFNAREVVKAIGRGFNPEIAELLVKGDYAFEMIALKDYGNTPKEMMRIKGRVIGAEGKSRKVIEELTESYICVYGKTIGLIGEPENVAIARRAIESLLSGSQHTNVYKWLEKQRRDLKRR